MEGILRWMLVTAIAPVAWGTTYYVTQAHLPADAPLYGAAIRALPAGLLLLALSRKRPHGSWWWKSLVLGTLNMGAFFALVYVSAQLLPTSIASAVMATSPLALMLLAWAMAGERPGVRAVAGAVIGVAGVGLLLLTGVTAVDPLGVLASAAALLMASVGYVLAKRWSAEVDVLAQTSWQLIAGGLLLLPLAVAVEGAPPHLDADALIAFTYVTVVGTAGAFTAWFAGLAHLPAATVGLVGLLNPVTGVLLGVLVAGDTLTSRQVAGLAMVLLGVLAGRPRRRTPAPGPAPGPAADSRSGTGTAAGSGAWKPPPGRPAGCR
ncbi:DMT family transporter [Streptomyces sp. NPDC090022]|uniref:DMT family transporter n=1 Tax=Streptomyces sp. NPDC090022 TaxID=3365920 RepID=UPI00382CE624